MQVGDLVKVWNFADQPMGIITKIVDADMLTARRVHYLVKLCNKKMGAYPFLQRQLEVISENR